MARRTFTMVDLIELYVHWYAGRSKSALAESLGLDRGTIRKYLAPAETAGLTPGGAPVGEEAWRERIAEWFPTVADGKLRQITWPAIAVHRDFIVEQMKAGVTKATIHQRLRDEHGLEAGLTSLKRWIEANLPDEVVRSRVTVWRPPVPPGEEAQIDYGSLGMWSDPVTGKRRRVWAFIMVLASSRHMFVRPVLTMDQASWTAAHVAAFDFFGGVPHRLVPDNLKTGVDRPDLYDPKLNRSYEELGRHYGTLIDPARARKPKDKPRVERQVPYVRDSFWRGREFGSIAEMQGAALTWCLQVAGHRSHRGLDGAAPLAVFEAAEQPALIALPPTRFTLATWSTAKVAPDCHIKVGKALYSVPWRLIGARVDVRATATMVQVFHDGKLVKTHVAAGRGKRTDHDDLPEEKIAYYMRTPAWCRTTAEQVGPSCVQVIAALNEQGVMFKLRQAQGILGLRDRHDPARLEAACRKALDAGDPSYRTIKGILALGNEDETLTRPTGDGGAAAFLHGPEQLFGINALATTGHSAVIPTSAADAADTMAIPDAFATSGTESGR
jgi:transposase